MDEPFDPRAPSAAERVALGAAGLLCALATSCSGDASVADGAGPDLGGGGGEPVELLGTLSAHNQVRRQVGLEPLSWDPALAAIAKAWAERCIDREAPAGLVDHNPDRGGSGAGALGENIFGASRDATGPGAVNAWAAEAANYTYASNQCSGTCGHYTQLVWRETAKVGCALQQCAGLAYGSTVVCNYSPAGNVNNRRPY
jgi:pathogenesis-related protein 1